MKFTKGPWVVIEDPAYIDIEGICTLQCDTDMVTGVVCPSNKQIANAHLISAAPDMYTENENELLFLREILDNTAAGSPLAIAASKRVEAIELIQSQARGEQ